MIDQTLTETIKEHLIAEYLKKNPGVHKSAVIARCKNGQIVVDHISRVMHDLNIRDRISDGREDVSKHSGLLQDFLQLDENERFKACQHSCKKSKVMVNMLFSAKHAKFGLVEKNETMDFLSRKERLCSSACLDLLRHKGELLRLMSVEEPQFVLIKSLTQMFLHASVSQLKTQLSVYNKEVDLGEFYQTFVKQLIEANIKKLKEALQTSSFLTVAKAYAALIGEEIAPLELSQLKPGKLEEMMAAFQTKLDQRMEEIEKIAAAVEIIEKILDLFEQSEGKKKTDDTKKPAAAKGFRMAFISKMFSKGKR